MIEHIVPTESGGRKKLTLYEDKDNYYYYLCMNHLIIIKIQLMGILANFLAKDLVMIEVKGFL